MQINDLMEKLAVLWPKKFNPEAIPVQAEAYRAALGQAQGERLECAWKLYLEKGVQTYAPSPRELRELLPTARAIPESGKSGATWKERRDADVERRRKSAEQWLMTWWHPLILAAQKDGSGMDAPIRRAAMVASNARAFAVTLAGGQDGRASIFDGPVYAEAMRLLMGNLNIRVKHIPANELPDNAIGMWKALHGGVKAEAQEAAA